RASPRHPRVIAWPTALILPRMTRIHADQDIGPSGSATSFCFGPSVRLDCRAEPPNPASPAARVSDKGGVRRPRLTELADLKVPTDRANRNQMHDWPQTQDPKSQTPSSNLVQPQRHRVDDLGLRQLLGELGLEPV